MVFCLARKIMAAQSRNGVWDGYSPSSSSQRPSALPHAHSFGRLPCVSTDEGLGINSIDGSVSSDQQSLFLAASTFVSAVTAMDKHVMVPNRLRDHRLPGSSTSSLSQQHSTVSATSNGGGERSRHNSGQSLSAGSLVGATSLSSDCSDPLGVTENGTIFTDELVDTDMYSCYRLLNTIKSELLSSQQNEDGSNGQADCESGDSDSENSNRAATPKEELVMFTADSSTSSVDETAASSMSALSLSQSPENNNNNNNNNSTSENNNSSSAEHPPSRRNTSASTSVAASSTEAVRQRFRIHLRGLMSILSQLTETANQMTNYYDRCLIPGGAGGTTTPLLPGGINTVSTNPSTSSSVPPNSFSKGQSLLNGQSHSNVVNGDVASHIFQPTRLF